MPNYRVMSIEQLIKELSKYPKTLFVYIPDDMNLSGYSPVGVVTLEKKLVKEKEMQYIQLDKFDTN